MPVDVVVISDIGATLGAIVAIPQIIMSLQRPQSLAGVSWFGLLLQAFALCSFLYVDVRLTLWVPALQIAGSLAGVLLLTGLKSWGANRQRFETGRVPTA
jgi:uncharacterized protein with PQ loop repeat